MEEAKQSLKHSNPVCIHCQNKMMPKEINSNSVFRAISKFLAGVMILGFVSHFFMGFDIDGPSSKELAMTTTGVTCLAVFYIILFYLHKTKSKRIWQCTNCGAYFKCIEDLPERD